MIKQSLKYSLINHKVITIIYMKGLEITQRRIQVLKIDDEMVKAIDIDKGQLRTFKIDNILSAMDTKLIWDEKSRRGYNAKQQTIGNSKSYTSVYTS